MQENEQKNSLIKRNILKYLENKGVSEYQFYKDTGIARGTLKNSSGLNEENIAKFLAYAQDIDYGWLLTGSGESMFRAKSHEVHEPRSEYKTLNNKLIPLIPVEAIAGFGSGNWSISENDIQDRYLVPDFNKIDFMIRVKGGSMYPKYSSGDVVACKKIETDGFIQWNRAHVISTKSQGILVKRIKPAEDESNLLMVSDNDNYPPFEVPKDEITGLAIVIGTIRLE